MTKTFAAFIVAAVLAPSEPAFADDATDRAREHYKSGLKLFEEGQREQALEHFRLANEAKPSPEAVFMMAQCEYHIGNLVDARAHYEGYLRAVGTGELAETARARIQAIDSRPSTFVINTDPAEVDVRLTGDSRTFTGRTPISLKVPRGRYQLTLSKTNHQTRTHDVDVGLAETKSLFYRLDPILARLEIQTEPPGATLYVNGMSALNPYRQDVPPGRYKIELRAFEHESRTLDLEFGPGERRLYDENHEGVIGLKYVQRSGKVELVAFSAAIATVGGAAAVLSALDTPTASPAASVTLAGAGGLVGGVAGGIVSYLVSPSYIRDNRALFVIGGMWMGAAEGAAVAMTAYPRTWQDDLTPTVMGGVVGLGVGTAATALLSRKAPNYGRAAVMQSSAALGGLSGALLKSALELDDRYMGAMVLGGLNLGLGVGLAAAYLSDQTQYGPTWQRAVLVDLAAIAGAVTGAITATVQGCLERRQAGGDSGDCTFEDLPRTSRFTLIGGFVGLAAGIAFTRGVDSTVRPPAKLARAAARFIPLPTALAIPSPAGGGVTLAPGLATVGRF